MKKIIIAVCLCFCGFAVSAQTSADADKQYKAELSRYFKVSGTDASFKVAMDQVLRMMGSSLDEARRTQIADQSYTQLIELFTPVYSRHIALEDLRAVNDFYETEPGKRLASAQAGMVSESMAIGQQWALSLQQMIQEAGKAEQ